MFVRLSLTIKGYLLTYLCVLYRPGILVRRRICCSVAAELANSWRSSSVKSRPQRRRTYLQPSQLSLPRRCWSAFCR